MTASLCDTSESIKLLALFHRLRTLFVLSDRLDDSEFPINRTKAPDAIMDSSATAMRSSIRLKPD